MMRHRILIDAILRLEPLILGIIGFAFWYPAPPRDQWLWLLALFIPVLGARWAKYGRVWTPTPLDGWLLALLALMIVNWAAAPYTRGFIMFSRPLFGVALYGAFVEHARERRNLDRLLTATTWLALLVGLLSLTATQWNSKSAPLSPIIDVLPTLQGFPGAEGGFNANEIAGAITWLQPLAIGIAAYRWRVRQPYMGALSAAILLTAGVFLGQSRLAIIGIGAAMGLLALVAVRQKAVRVLALVVLVLAAGLEYVIFSYPVQVTRETGLSSRDEQSLIGRQDIWGSALNILRDYPLTGVGMSMFRDGRVRERYPAPGYRGTVLPHAHNEWLQVGADFGVPGIVVFAGWHLAAGSMLIYSWRKGSDGQKTIAAALLAALLAHGVFGLADAITLWDRFIFVYWWLLALIGAQFAMLKCAE